MVNPYPLPRQSRETPELVGNGGRVYGPFDFRIFDIEDIIVLVKNHNDDGWQVQPVTVKKIDQEPFDFFNIEFPAAIDNFVIFRVLGWRVAERSTDLVRGGALQADELEKELSKQAVVLQELRRDTRRIFGIGGKLGDAVNKAAHYRDEAARWASDPEDGPPIDDGKNPPGQSAFHWSRKAEKAEQSADYSARKADGYAQDARQSEARAQELVDAAQAGYVGFQPNTFYDLGHVRDTIQLFSGDLGFVRDIPDVREKDGD